MKFRFRLHGSTWDEVSDDTGIWGQTDEEDTIPFMLEYLKERMKGNKWTAKVQEAVGRRIKAQCSK